MSSDVYFIKDISPESLTKLYIKMGVDLKPYTGVKISTGEPGGHNFLSPDLIGRFVRSINGTIVECNTAYEGKRADSKNHWKTIKDHGFYSIAKCDILDEEGEMEIPVVGNHFHLTKNIIGSHMSRYNSFLVLSHFKGHMMAGFGGALKNMSIGFASSVGKINIHTGGTSLSFSDTFTTDVDIFHESMADAVKSVIEHVGSENLFYINVANNLSVDCDCSDNPKDPCMEDIGIFASYDPVAIDQACIDAVMNSDDDGKFELLTRINSRHGTHILDAAEKLGLGTKSYNLITIR